MNRYNSIFFFSTIFKKGKNFCNLLYNKGDLLLKETIVSSRVEAPLRREANRKMAELLPLNSQRNLYSNCFNSLFFLFTVKILKIGTP